MSIFKKTHQTTLKRLTPLVLALTLCSTLLLTGCEKPVGSGQMGSKNKTLSGFKSIEICGNPVVNLIRSGKESVKITADDNLLNDIQAEVISGELVLNCNKAQREHTLKITKPPVFDVEFVEINAMVIDGDSEVTTPIDKKAIKGNDFSFTSNGASKVKLAVAVKNLQLQISGQAKIEMRGTADTQQVLLMGSSTYKAEELITTGSNISISGDGKVFVSADKTLDITINGNGSLFYKGGPLVQQTINGTGTVGKINLSTQTENTEFGSQKPATPPANALPTAPPPTAPGI